MGTINWTHEAELWLHDIYTYIAKENSDAANKVMNGIFERVQVLKEFPEIGAVYQVTSKGQVRTILYGHYKIAYIFEKNENITVLGVFHTSLNISEYFLYES